uniref:Uncharacterized protein n=1 Tax=Panagrolaimus sp. PS1159 TaxID=55785 RepID=A0AC35GRQ7_9BILA
MVKHKRKSLYCKKKLEGNKADNHEEMTIKNTVAEGIELSKSFKRDLTNTIEEKVMVIEKQELYSHPFSIPNGVDKSDKGLSTIDRRESITCSVSKPVLFPAERNKVKLKDGNVNDGIKNACDNEFYDFKNSQVAPVCQANYAYKVKVKFKEKELLVNVIKPVVALYCSGNMKNKSVATISHATVKASFVYAIKQGKLVPKLSETGDGNFLFPERGNKIEDENDVTFHHVNKMLCSEKNEDLKSVIENIKDFAEVCEDSKIKESAFALEIKVRDNTPGAEDRH